MIVEGDVVTDLALPCTSLLTDGRHVIRFLDLTDFSKSVCQHCHQTVAIIRIKGENFVY
jgi:hypothetical protein